jgi:arylsulfatase A-like enzyme
MRRLYLSVFLFLAPLLAASSPPNVVVILTDDQGWGDLSLHGNPSLETPHLDKLAHSGARLNRFYVSPVCAPTRASFLTGKFHQRTGVHGVTRGQENMSLDEVTLADLFQEAGYRTGIFGKWHNGAHYPYHPNGRGFDQFVGFCAGHWSNYFDALIEENGKPHRSEGYMTDYLTDRAIGFIEESVGQEKPFICYIPYQTPHTPYQVPDEPFEKYVALGLDPKLACLMAMCENIDNNVGRVIAALERLKIRKDTIVIFFSDNGPNTFRYNDGLKGKKGSVDEGGMRVPCFVSWPAKISEKLVVDEVTAHIDLLPTLMEWIGREDLIPDDIDGRSLAPLLVEGTDIWLERELYMTWGKQTRIWNQRYALIEGELFDLVNDPHQTRAIESFHPEIAENLQKKLDAWLKENYRERTPFAIPVGYPEFPTTELPAHESVLYPKRRFASERADTGISYVTRWGWANDWVTNWTSKDAYVSWDIDVITSGQYEVTLFYTCPEEDAGSQLVLEAKEDALRFTITEGFDPPLYLDRDRFPRTTEVGEKDWKRIQLGLLELPPGSNSLKLRAEKIPGSQVMDLKAVSLRLINPQ